ncbi:MAG: hypothetical protein AAGK21_11410 [Bacteroidota bacterium]
MRLRIVTLAALVALPMAGAAQSVPGWAEPVAPPPAPTPATSMEGPPPRPGGTPTQVPIDGGLGLLALAGGAYAAHRLRRRPA